MVNTARRGLAPPSQGSQKRVAIARDVQFIVRPIPIQVDQLVVT
jgi:hypothetical protein